MAFPSHGVTHRPTVTGTRGMVSSAHPLASLAGCADITSGRQRFRRGCCGRVHPQRCTEPYMSGIAGCGYMLIYNAKEDKRPRPRLHGHQSVPSHARRVLRSRVQTRSVSGQA